MPRLRAHRFITALIVVLSLLFSQLALAQYVCPQQQDADAMAEMMASGMPCEGMDAQQPALCHEHAATTAQAAEAFKLPTPSLPAVVLVLEAPLVLVAPDAVALPAPRRSEPRPPPDPLFLSTLRLRV